MPSPHRPTLRATLTGLAWLAAALAPLAAHAELVTNGGFETEGAERHHLLSWTVAPADGSLWRVSDYRRTGEFGAQFGGSEALSLSQTLATTAGQTYDYSFWVKSLARPISDPRGQFTATADGMALMAAFYEPPPPADPDGPFDGPFTLFSGSFTALDSATVLSFSTLGRVFYVLDDVSVVAGSNAVPEPASIALLGLGLVGLTAVRRRAGSATRPG